jgi:hypothetical protein
VSDFDDVTDVDHGAAHDSRQLRLDAELHTGLDLADGDRLLDDRAAGHGDQFDTAVIRLAPLHPAVRTDDQNTDDCEPGQDLHQPVHSTPRPETRRPQSPAVAINETPRFRKGFTARSTKNVAAARGDYRGT